MSTSGSDFSSCHTHIGSAPRLRERMHDILLAVGTGEDDDPDARVVTHRSSPRRTRSRDWREAARTSRSHSTLRLVGVVGLDVELDQLADAHVLDTRVAEGRQRALDRLPLRIGDPGLSMTFTRPSRSSNASLSNEPARRNTNADDHQHETEPRPPSTQRADACASEPADTLDPLTNR